VLPAGTATVNGKTVVTLNLPGDSCCGQQSGPNVTGPMDSILAASATMNYDLHYQGVGGDRVGAIMLSKYISPNNSASLRSSILRFRHSVGSRAPVVTARSMHTGRPTVWPCN
jgi:hypothetical protein